MIKRASGSTRISGSRRHRTRPICFLLFECTRRIYYSLSCCDAAHGITNWLETQALLAQVETSPVTFFPSSASGFLVLLWETSMVQYCSH